MSLDAAERDLEARLEALRRELARLVAAIADAGQQLEDLADELRSRRQADKVVALDHRRRRPRSSDSDILVDFFERR
jgi:chromosome segregation ATPase